MNDLSIPNCKTCPYLVSTVHTHLLAGELLEKLTS
uniref:Uncharacterized protein n=1 Tax=Rhizophora mucronata TaxID=61149 RepID=A0A2P2QS89_RHIMU